MVITTFSSGIISSILKSPPEYSILDLLSSPYLSLISISSSLIIVILLSSLSRILLRSLIVFINSSNSPLSLSCSRPVNCLKRISTIAFDWISESLNSFINLILASSAFDEDLIKAITLSILSEAIIKPSNICALSSAFFNSYFVLLTTTSCLCSTKYPIICFRFNICGRPLTNAILLTLKDDWSWVCLNKVFKTTLGTESLFKI